MRRDEAARVFRVLGGEDGHMNDNERDVRITRWLGACAAACIIGLFVSIAGYHIYAAHVELNRDRIAMEQGYVQQQLATGHIIWTKPSQAATK
jgi:hypothetical protein